jgi:2-methylcitrate dehydratase PrpD
MEIAGKLARWIGNTHHEMIPKVVLEKAKLSILDTIGVTIAGGEDDVGRMIKDYVNSLGGKPSCTMIGTSIRTSPPLAALGNGVMGHALDLDDISYSYLGHPSVSVLPAALAIGELMDATGIQVLGAYIIGTEVACKVGAMVSPKYYEDGWHSCVISVFGATAAAGKLLGLTEDQMVQALALGVSMASGVRGNIGTMAKPFQMGRSAENGVVATLLAKKGMTGSPNIFEKKFGFCHTFKVSSEFESFYSKMGKPFDIDVPGFGLKEFSSCSATHAALNAIIRLIREHRIEPEQVESVDCATTPLVASSLTYPKPRNANQARFSMHFCLAIALLNRGDVKVTEFQDNKVNDY